MKDLTASLCLLISIIGQAQTNTLKKTTLSLGYGLPNIPALALSTEVESKAFSPLGPVIAGYSRDVGKRLTLGAELAFSSAKTVPVTEPNFRYHYHVGFFTGLVRGDINYVSKPKYRIYSGLALGVYNVKATAKVIEGNGTPTKYNETGTGFAWHINACGTKWLIKNGFGIYAELGIGYRGVLNTGVFYNF